MLTKLKIIYSSTRSVSLYIQYHNRIHPLFVSVLWAICKNPDGFFWAGDTAQTISAGSSFRFDDLKAFMHRVEVCHLILAFSLCDTSAGFTECFLGKKPSDVSTDYQLSLARRYRQSGALHCAINLEVLAALRRCPRRRERHR